MERKTTVVTSPVVIFKIVSDGTGHIDPIDKDCEYATTLSVKRYIMLSPDHMSGTMFERIGDDWVGRLLDADASVQMPEVGIEVPIGEFDDGVDFERRRDATSEPSP